MNFKYILILMLIALGAQTVLGQAFDVNLSSAESGTQSHQARNSISLLAGYNYAPGGSGMEAIIVNPVVTGSTSYNYTPVDPTTRSLNTSYLVGTTQGSFDVNPAGGASYTIPIDVLPGVNGLAPSLSLVYSSNSGPGVAGYGWQIGGISVVSRTGQNFYNDGKATGIELDYNDRYSIDGQRLVLAPSTGSWGGHLTTYQTENDIFTRVQSQYSSGSGPLKFMAQTKSGLKNLYGFTDDGCQKIDGYQEIINWFVTETQDLYGNIISYAYLKDNNSVYPGEISYGPNKISFYYKERSDISTTYLKGKKIQQRLLLDKITVSYNSNVVKTYELKYNYLSNSYYGQSVLNEVVEYGTAGSQLNSTVFSYQQPGNISLGAETYLFTQADISTNSTLYTGDFNGDGRADIYAVSKSNPKNWKLYIGNDNWGYFTLSDSGTADYQIIDVLVSDLNGDNKDDLIRICLYGSTYYYYWQVSNGTTLSLAYRFEYFITQYARPTPLLDQRVCDFDGDGFNDFLLIVKPQNTWKIYSFTEASINSTFLANNRSGTISSWGDKVYTADFNGDGKTDIWVFDANGLKIYSLSGSNLNQIYTSTWPTKDHYFQLGDFNGDGKTDMFVYGYSSYDWTDWQIHLATGTGFEGHSFTAQKSNLKDDKVFATDFNADGRTDILALSKNSSNNPRQYYFISNSNGDSFSNQYQENSYLNKDYDYALSDFSGDGKTDILVAPSTTGFRRLITTGTENNYLMKFLCDGLGNTIETVYSRLTDPYCYDKTGGSSSFPVFTYQGPMTVVNRVWYNGAATHSFEYTYKGLNIHRQGKGILGFAQTKVTDYAPGIITENLSGYNSTYFYPQVNTVTTKTTAGTLIETISNSWTERIIDNSTKRIIPYISSSTQKNELTNQTVVTTSSLNDDYGNPATITKAFKTGTTDEGSQSVSYLYQSENVTNWLLGRPTKTTTTYSRGGENVTQVINREFSTTTNLDTAEVRFPGTVKEIRFSKVCYPNGNLRKQIAKTGGVSRVTSYVYNSDNVRIYTETDPLGHITTSNYNSYGQLSSEKDYLNNQDSYTYDNLGRMLTKTQSDGFVTTNSYNWGINTFSNSVYNLTTSGNDGFESKTWYDKLGREIRSDKKGFDGQYIYTLTNYNSVGQVQQVSEPSTSSSPSQWTKYYYWPEGRLQKVERHTGSVTNYTYNGITATENTDGKVRYKETDSQGLIAKAHDAGGDILYAYYPDGKVKTITAPGNAVTTMEYTDDARNQTKLIDPSAGTIQYTYDGFGQLKSVIDARNQTTSYNYKANGLLDTKSSPYETIAYLYNTNNTLSGVSNTKTNYTYSVGYEYFPDNDANRGKIKKITESIPGNTSSQTTFTYDTKGRLDTKTHPSGIIEKTDYNTYGYFKSISVGSTKYYEVTGMNARQQITAATYGSLVATWGYDTYGYPLSHDVKSGAIYKQNYSYSFDAVTGHLNRRDNLVQSKYETFNYDTSYDRLTSVAGNSSLTVDYFDNGNIKLKTDVHATVNFSYNVGAGPYALTGVTSSSTIPSTIQKAHFTSFQKADTIKESPYEALLYYNADRQRCKMVVNQSGTNILTRWYVGNCYMKETAGAVTKEYTYLGGDAYTAPIAAVTQGGTTTYYYLLRDYLGNITNVYNTTTGTNDEYSFDAWGRRRNPTNLTYDLTGQPELFADRGFTSHEHLKWFNVVNMNGRLYDPVVGRFLSPDPYVQMPDYSQNLNRYSYCLNNPLKYNDPEGEWFFSLIFPGVGTVIDVFLWSATLDYATQVVTNYVTREPGSKFSDWAWKKIDWLDVGVSGVAAVATMGLDNLYKAKKISKPLFKAGKAAIDFGLPALSARYDWTPAANDKKFSINKGSDFWTDYTFTVVKQKVATKNTDEIIDGLFGDKPWILNHPLKGELWKKTIDVPSSIFFGWWSNKATQPEPKSQTKSQIPSPGKIPELKPGSQNFNRRDAQDNLTQIENSLKLSF